MYFFAVALLSSLVAFFAIRFTFKLEQQQQIQVDAIMIGLFTLLYVGLVGLIGRDWAMSALNMMGMFVGVILYRSLIGWPSTHAIAHAFPRRPKTEKQAIVITPAEDDPNWLSYRYQRREED